MNACCSICEAQFGLKFGKRTCGNCRHLFRSGHLIGSRFLTVHQSIRDSISLMDGICYTCLFEIWGRSNIRLGQPQGITGRAASVVEALWERAGRAIASGILPTELIQIDVAAFERINRTRALAVFRHQQEVPYEFIIQDLATFARAFSVSQGRRSEKDVCLTDVYHFVDWFRSHLRIPRWAHNLTWNTLESSPAGLAYLMDVWHVVSAAVALSNPLSGFPWAIYHLGDRAIDQGTGKGLIAYVYDTVKTKLGMNINPAKAFVAYLAGLFLTIVYDKPK